MAYEPSSFTSAFNIGSSIQLFTTLAKVVVTINQTLNCQRYSGAAYIARGLYACTSSELMFLYLCTV